MSEALTSARAELRRSWNSVLDKLEESVNPSAFNTWLRATEPLRVEGWAILIEARYGADCDWLNRQFACIMSRAAEAVFGDGATAAFVPQSVSRTPVAPAPLLTAQNASPAADTRPGPVSGLINPRFTFERYLPASGNRLALQACLDLLGPAPGAASPVVMFGDPGLGKTHLLHALATRASAQGMSVVSLTARGFTDRFLPALRDNRVPEFQASVRNAQLLLVDDLQYFIAHPATADEFALAIDDVTNAGGLVACASECNPDQLRLPARLISRLKAGVPAMLLPLDAADRRAYVTARAHEDRVSFPSWAVDRIAACEAPSIRVLQGAFNTALTLHRAGELEPEKLDRHLGGVCERAATPESLDTRGVIDLIAAHYDLTAKDVMGRHRSAVLDKARAVTMAALVARGGTLSQVASIFDGRNRSTVKGASDRGRALLAAQPTLRARVVA